MIATQTNETAEVQTNVAPTVDEGFIKAFTQVDRVGEQLGGKWAKVARYVIENKVTRDVVLNSLKKMGKKYETAQSITSRIMDLVKPENQWKLDKMESGELTVKDARATNLSLGPDGKIVRAPIAQRPASVRIADFLQSASNIAVTEKIEISDLIGRLTEAYNLALQPKAKADKKAE